MRVRIADTGAAAVAAIIFALLSRILAGGAPYRGLSPGQFWFWTSIELALTLAAFVGAFVLLRRARMLEDTPTSRVRSAAQGYVELEGIARLLPGPEIISPLSRQRCAWWSYSISCREGDDWVVVERETSGELFLVSDTTGDCIVDPEGARVLPSLDRRWRGSKLRPDLIPKRSEWISFGQYRYHEQQVRIGDTLYATGRFRTQTAQQDYNEARDVSELLADWKHDQRELLQRFDANHDGQIDLEEWEAARSAAIGQVRAQLLEQSLNPDINVLSRPGDARPFILSTLTKQQMVRRYRFRALVLLAVALAAGALNALMLRLAPAP